MKFMKMFVPRRRRKNKEIDGVENVEAISNGCLLYRRLPIFLMIEFNVLLWLLIDVEIR